MSQVVHQTTLQGVRPFFGNNFDTRGEYFTHLNYLGSEFAVAINQGNVPMIESQPVFQLLLCQNYKNCASGEEFFIHEDMIDLIANTAAFHKIIDYESAKNVGLIVNKEGDSNGFAKFLLDTVYRGWGNLSSDVRKFYATHLHILVKSPGGWMQPADVAVAANLPYDNIRLNLTKVDMNDPRSGILFASTLPKLTNTVKGFRIVTPGGGVKSVPTPGGCPEDLLQQIYNSVYSSDNIIVNSVIHGPYAYNNYDKTKYTFNLDAVKFSKNVILAHAQGASAKQTSAATAAAANKDNFDDIFTSLTTGVTFMRDGSDLIRIDGNVKTKMDKTQLDLDLDPRNGCYGTKIKGDCDVVFKCLLHGEPQNLSRCLGKLKDQNMFKVAQREVELMNPNVARQLLKTFGFTPRKESPSGLLLPPSFDEWRQHILPKSVDSETHAAIVDNAQLMNYLKGLVNLIRSNPTILNEKMGDEPLSEYARKASMRKFMQPKLAGDRAQLNASMLEQGVLLSRSTIGSMPLAGLVGNIGTMMASPFMLHGGGDKPNCPNANMLKNMFDVTYSEMERNGKVLVEADKARITDSIKRVAHLEEQLVRILEDLKLFTKLNTTFSIGRGSIGVEEVGLADVVGVSQASSVTGEALGNLKNCASQNITEQSKLMGDLILQIQKSLVGTLMGAEKNPLLERVYSGRM